MILQQEVVLKVVCCIFETSSSCIRVGYYYIRRRCNEILICKEYISPIIKATLIRNNLLVHYNQPKHESIHVQYIMKVDNTTKKKASARAFVKEVCRR